jgi:hypothetical protein
MQHKTKTELGLETGEKRSKTLPVAGFFLGIKKTEIYFAVFSQFAEIWRT